MFVQQDAIRECMEGYPGDLYEEPFVDFSTTRNYALRVMDTTSGHYYGLQIHACRKTRLGLTLSVKQLFHCRLPVLFCAVLCT